MCAEVVITSWGRCGPCGCDESLRVHTNFMYETKTLLALLLLARVSVSASGLLLRPSRLFFFHATFCVCVCVCVGVGLVHQALALALRVEHLVWGMEAMSAGLSMGQLDTLKAVLLDQVARVDEAKVREKRGEKKYRARYSSSATFP